MRGLSQRFASFLPPLFFRRINGDKRLIFTISALFTVGIFYLIVGVFFLFYTHYSISRMDNLLSNDLKIINGIEKDLAVLPFQEQYPVTPKLDRLTKSVSLFSETTQTEPNCQLIKSSLSDLVKISANSKEGQTNQGVRQEILKCRVLVDQLADTLVEKRQSINERILSKAHIYELGWILVVVCLIGIGTIALTKLLKKHREETEYFENIAYQFKTGVLDKVQFNYSGQYLTELNLVLSDYISLIRERYQLVKNQIKNLNFQTNEISLFSKQNETIYREIKQNLEHLVEHTYQQFDKYHVLAGRIKSLNFNLGDSQKQILDFQGELQKAVRVFQKAPEAIEEIDTLVRQREDYLKSVVGRLYELRAILDKLLQTGSVFQNVAEQNTLLALNASIEAARADTIGGFDFAAVEIARLAEKISRVSKELLAVVDLMGTKGNAAMKNLEMDLVRNSEVKHFIETVGNKINVFCLKLSQLLDEAIKFSIMIEALGDKHKALEELTESLGQVNQSSQNNYGRAAAALEVIKKSGEISVATDQLERLTVELGHLMNRIII